MTRQRKIQRLATEIEALALVDRLELLRRLLTPEIELQLLAQELRQRAAGHDPEELAREVDETVRELRLQRQSQATA